MKCPICDSEAVTIKRQILEYSVITFLQCSDKKCSHKFVSTNITKQSSEEEQDNSKGSRNNEVKKSKSFHFLDNRN